ncbi:hypothetical protein COLO4_11192 [Corchorus olitorius]|uniref:Uncharacterized protein n=1 Tax=Corchorus olitorius TaxID=93759 RepID=A0A1R3K5E8_9ROSI|nr:hypothetical protein COLO4_11192 [Corchorus olitorius]
MEADMVVLLRCYSQANGKSFLAKGSTTTHLPF